MQIIAILCVVTLMSRLHAIMKMADLMTYPFLETSPPLMFRNARSNENVRFDESSSKRLNFQIFDNFGEFSVKFV